ncbi:hypothetical protein [Microbulbifer sp. GL-2]|uniref:hypothetical protein n=1 Tax=Microbulbifer sp. GL-2 TaxID=2591606 RepID=UPI0011640FEA|nr:hypothetical protein [Microbulbifer sp. GL-2]BBM03175.1 hypothetical protein GL2_32490 [Microbulbifer sp. GL-2]
MGPGAVIEKVSIGEYLVAEVHPHLASQATGHSIELLHHHSTNMDMHSQDNQGNLLSCGHAERMTVRILLIFYA